jgi:hypothetical protein
MAKYIRRDVCFVDSEVELSDREVMTIAQAAEELDVYTQAVSLALDRGDLTLIINPNAPKRQGRRLVLRSEVEAWSRRRAKRRGRKSRPVVYSW